MIRCILILFIFFGFNLSCFSANVMPFDVIKPEVYTLGVYQSPNKIKLYSLPNEKAEIVFELDLEEKLSEDYSFANIFLVHIVRKDLAFLMVTDETENWVEVVYNKSKKLKGWLKKDDPYRFLTWINFYNMYGRKYGLYILKGAPKVINDIRSATGDNAQLVSTMNMPSKIKFNVLRGNWVLVSVMDMDKTSKTGFIRWRGDDGEIYLFPDIK